MNSIATAAIVIGERQRQKIGQTDLDKLKRSIVSKGLLHPIVINSKSELVAGERRLTAIKQLHEEGLDFCCDGLPVQAGFIPYTNILDLSPDDFLEAEVEENIFRVALSWQEEVSAIAMIHELRKRENPKQTATATAIELAGLRGTASKTEMMNVSRAMILKEHAANPRVARAKTASEAFKAVLDEQEKRFQANLVVQEQTSERTHTIIHGDCREEMLKLQTGSIATILADPPYGISADKQGKESNHYYDDSPEHALEICEFIIREGFRVCKPRAVLFMFCDIEHFLHLREYAKQQAWSTYRTPIIWSKADAANGSAPWGKAGFTRSYEVMLFAVKGQAELRIPGGKDVLYFDRVSRGARVHAAEKPFALLYKLVSISTMAGETILDPCAGSGSIIPAATKHLCRVIAIERDDSSYAECLSRLAGGGDGEGDGESLGDEDSESAAQTTISDLINE